MRNSELTESLERQTATAEILRVISGSALTCSRSSRPSAENAVRLSGARFGSVYRYDGEHMHMVAHHSYPPEALEFSRRAVPGPATRELFTGRCILDRRVVHVPDVERDKESLARPAPGGGVRFRSVRCRSPCCTTVGRRRDHGLGRRGQKPFSDKHVGLLLTFADQAVIMPSENARLFARAAGRTGADAIGRASSPRSARSGRR